MGQGREDRQHVGDQNSERQRGIGLSLLPLERRGSLYLGPAVPACRWLRAASGMLTVQPASAQETRSLSQKQPQAGVAGVFGKKLFGLDGEQRC